MESLLTRKDKSQNLSLLENPEVNLNFTALISTIGKTFEATN